MQVADFLRPENVILDLVAPTKLRVLQILSEKAARALDLPEGLVLQPLLSREKLGSTGIGEGIAIPHTRITGVAKPFGLFARLSKTLEFESIDDIPVDIVFVLLMPGENGTEHLNVLACIARQLRSPHILRQLRNARDSGQIYEALTADMQAPR